MLTSSCADQVGAKSKTKKPVEEATDDEPEMSSDHASERSDAEETEVSDDIKLISSEILPSSMKDDLTRRDADKSLNSADKNISRWIANKDIFMENAEKMSAQIIDDLGKANDSIKEICRQFEEVDALATKVIARLMKKADQSPATNDVKVKVSKQFQELFSPARK